MNREYWKKRLVEAGEQLLPMLFLVFVFMVGLAALIFTGIVDTEPSNQTNQSEINLNVSTYTENQSHGCWNQVTDNSNLSQLKTCVESNEPVK